jgi:hypothetical protein
MQFALHKGMLLGMTQYGDNIGGAAAIQAAAPSSRWRHDSGPATQLEPSMPPMFCWYRHNLVKHTTPAAPTPGTGEYAARDLQ